VLSGVFGKRKSLRQFDFDAIQSVIVPIAFRYLREGGVIPRDKSSDQLAQKTLDYTKEVVKL